MFAFTNTQYQLPGSPSGKWTLVRKIGSLFHVISFYCLTARRRLRSGNHIVTLLRRIFNVYKYSATPHYGDVIMGPIASQITRLTIVYSTVNSDADQGKRQSSASLAFVRGIHRGPVNSQHKWPVTRNIFPFDDVIIIQNKHCRIHRGFLIHPHMLVYYCWNIINSENCFQHKG